MITLLIIVNILLLAYPLLNNNKEWFSPPVLFAILMFTYTFPDFVDILLLGPKDYINNLIFDTYCDPEYAIARMLVIQALFVIVYYISFKKFFQIKNAHDIIQSSYEYRPISLYSFSILIFCFCLIVSISYISEIGGLSALFMSFTRREDLWESQGIAQTIAPTLMTIGSALYMKFLSTSSKKHYLSTALMLMAGCLTYILNGGRSQLIVFIISILCFYNFWFKKVNLLSVKYIPLYLLMLVFILAFQLLRFEETRELSSSMMIDNFSSVFDSMAYIKTQILIETYFDRHEFWFGKVYTFLVYLFVPRSIMPNKPFIDEGVYIYNMIDNKGNLLDNLDLVNSWPPYTSGIGYANFGIIGVIIGAIILAYIHSFLYRKILKNNFPVFQMILYIYIILKFQLTIFYLANVVYLMIQLYLFAFVFNFFSRKYKTHNNTI